MSTSLQEAAEAYLSSEAPRYSSEKQTLVASRKTCIMPLINATLAKIALDYNTSYDQVIKKYIELDFDITNSIGQDAFEVLYKALQDRNDNVALVSALILLEGSSPSNKTLQAVSTARQPLWKKREKTGKFDRIIDSTLWWIYCFILYHARSDPNYDRHFLETLSQVGFNDPISGLEAIKQESYRVLLKNLVG